MEARGFCELGRVHVFRQDVRIGEMNRSGLRMSRALPITNELNPATKSQPAAVAADRGVKHRDCTSFVCENTLFNFTSLPPRLLGHLICGTIAFEC